MKEEILKAVTKHYFESGEFNGLPCVSLIIESNDENNRDIILSSLKELLEDNKIDIVYGDNHPNPHIKAFSDIDKKDQINKLTDKDSIKFACIYPSQSHLQNKINSTKYNDRPYTKELALGAGQLDFRTFDVSVLEIYRNDPRYYYKNYDISGSISVHDEYFESDNMVISDQILLQTFGFCYNENFDRGVAVYLCYLHKLSPEHQQIWKSKELSGKYTLHPDYYRNSILGIWGTRISIFAAFIEELEIINLMSEKIGKPHFFHNTFRNDRPREFGFLLRPTLSEFNNFVHLLDKMMSDNINKEFFKDDLNLEREEKRNDGKIIVCQKGTIQLLAEWLYNNFRPYDKTPIEEMFASFRNVRNLRMKPAHAVSDNVFDQKYFKKQRELIKDAYNAIRTIRLVFTNFPSVKANPPKIDKLLFEGKIWDI